MKNFGIHSVNILKQVCEELKNKQTFAPFMLDIWDELPHIGYR